MKHKHISRHPLSRGAAAPAGASPARACGKNGGKSSTIPGGGGSILVWGYNTVTDSSSLSYFSAQVLNMLYPRGVPRPRFFRGADTSFFAAAKSYVWERRQAA